MEPRPVISYEILGCDLAIFEGALWMQTQPPERQRRGAQKQRKAAKTPRFIGAAFVPESLKAHFVGKLGHRDAAPVVDDLKLFVGFYFDHRIAITVAGDDIGDLMLDLNKVAEKLKSIQDGELWLDQAGQLQKL